VSEEPAKMTDFSHKSQKEKTAFLVEFAEHEDFVILKVLFFQKRER
jgi:hypothetical protein